MPLALEVPTTSTGSFATGTMNRLLPKHQLIEILVVEGIALVPGVIACLNR